MAKKPPSGPKRPISSSDAQARWEVLQDEKRESLAALLQAEIEKRGIQTAEPPKPKPQSEQFTQRRLFTDTDDDSPPRQPR